MKISLMKMKLCTQFSICVLPCSANFYIKKTCPSK